MKKETLKELERKINLLLEDKAMFELTKSENGELQLRIYKNEKEFTEAINKLKKELIYFNKQDKKHLNLIINKIFGKFMKKEVEDED